MGSKLAQHMSLRSRTAKSVGIITILEIILGIISILEIIRGILTILKIIIVTH